MQFTYIFEEPLSHVQLVIPQSLCLKVCSHVSSFPALHQFIDYYSQGKERLEVCGISLQQFLEQYICVALEGYTICISGWLLKKKSTCTAKEGRKEVKTKQNKKINKQKGNDTCFMYGAGWGFGRV